MFVCIPFHIIFISLAWHRGKNTTMRVTVCYTEIINVSSDIIILLFVNFDTTHNKRLPWTSSKASPESLPAIRLDLSDVFSLIYRIPK